MEGCRAAFDSDGSNMALIGELCKEDNYNVIAECAMDKSSGPSGFFIAFYQDF